VYIKVQKERPEGIKRLERPMRYCQMVIGAEDTPFYAAAEDHLCPTSRFYFGLQRRNKIFFEQIKEMLQKFGHIEGEESLRNAPLLPEGEKYFIFSKKSKDEDLCIYFGTPSEILEVARQFTKKAPLSLSLFGFASFCQEATVYPLLKGAPNISLGCCGARKAGLLDTELILSLPRRSWDGF
jgi:uncharacterized protein (DUF169 family)